MKNLFFFWKGSYKRIMSKVSIFLYKKKLRALSWIISFREEGDGRGVYVMLLYTPH